MTQDMPTAPPDRRRRRWLELHDVVYQAACELFLEEGFEATSFAQIGDRADVARKTVFNHFPRKRDFITEWARRRRARALENLSEDLLAQPHLDAVLHHYYLELAQLYEKERHLSITMLLGWRTIGGPFDDDNHPMIPEVSGFIAAARDRGEVRDDVNIAWVATLFYSMYFGILYDWCKGNEDAAPFDLGEALAHLVDVMIGGLLVRSDKSDD